MRINVNGRELEAPSQLTGAGLAELVGITLSVAVAEVNGLIVPRSQFAELELKDGDTIEIVTVVGGG